MTWNNKTFESVNDILSAMKECQTEEEAKLFLDAYGENAEFDLGYCTGYLPREEGNRLRELFNIEHPFLGKNVSFDNITIFSLAFKVGELSKTYPLLEALKIAKKELNIYSKPKLRNIDAPFNVSKKYLNESDILP